MVDNSVSEATVVAKHKTVYDILFRLMVRGRHRLLISLNGDPNTVQIPVFVKHPLTQLKDPVPGIQLLVLGILSTAALEMKNS